LIYVSKEQLRQVEYLIGQSMQGHHVLFDTDTVRRVFQKSRSNKDTHAVENHIEALMQQPTLLQKRAYLEKLPPKIFESVVITYFNIVENNMAENQEVKH
jgi:hypothetical protein